MSYPVELARFEQRQRGGMVLIDKDGQAFYKNLGPKNTSNKITWRCSKYKEKCKAKVVTIENFVYSRYELHNHQ